MYTECVDKLRRRQRLREDARQLKTVYAENSEEPENILRKNKRPCDCIKMFIRPSLVKTQIKRNKKNKRSLMKTLGIFEIQQLSDEFYENFSKGKTIDKFFQERAISKKHKKDFEIILFNKFLKSFKGIDNYERKNLKILDRFVNISKIDPSIDLGYVYCFEINNKIKIGRTISIINRIENYKSHIGETPIILKLILIPKHKDFEGELKRNLNLSNSTNEWFEIDKKEFILENFK